MRSIVLQLVVGSIVFAMLGASAAAQLGVPHQFFGAVTTNGAPAPDGITVMATISVQEVASTTTVGGSYGLLPGDIFYIEDPDGTNSGKTIEFYVGGVKAAEYVFSNGESTELDLAVTGDFGVCGDNSCSDDESCSSCASDCGSCPPSSPSGGSKSSSGGGYVPPAAACEENWTCSAWSACSQDGRQLRSCTDANSCGTEDDKPSEEETCTYTPAAAPKICAAGTRVCVNNDLMDCPDGTYWNLIESCEFGCDADAIQCKTASGEVAGGDGLTGFLAANTIAFYGLLVVVLAILGGAVYWKKYR